MTTVVVTKKGGQVAMAADSLVTFGDTRLGHEFEDNTKIFKIDTPHGVTYLGMAGTVAHFPAVRKAIESLPKQERLFNSKDAVYDTFLKLHPVLKDKFFLQTKEEDSDPYESSQFTVLVANSSGIYGLYSYREVFEFKQYWAIGSGRSFALGAMHATANHAKTAREWAEIGVKAGCQFDKNSGGTLHVVSQKLKSAI
jgi:ATP-dependent protease HslVU (ClpYQ) peptidase subunit